MLFRRDVLSAIGRGDVTAAFRRWRRPTVRAGGTLRTAVGVLAIDSVEAIDEISEEDARDAGYASAEAARDDLAERDGALYRVRFHLAGEDPRIALRRDATVDRGDLEKLETLDRSGPWTRTVLELIENNPAVHAKALAAQFGEERLAFKRRVRRLKELGLTESLPVGYRLSARGAAVLQHLRGKR